MMPLYDWRIPYTWPPHKIYAFKLNYVFANNVANKLQMAMITFWLIHGLTHVDWHTGIRVNWVLSYSYIKSKRFPIMQKVSCLSLLSGYNYVCRWLHFISISVFTTKSRFVTQGLQWRTTHKKFHSGFAVLATVRAYNVES